MFVFSKGQPKTIHLLKDRKNRWRCGSWGKKSSRGKDGKLVSGERYTSDEFGARFNIWRINTGKGYSTKDACAYQHPAIFPEALARDHILSWSNPGDIVLDPMCGSGTTLKMAEHLERKWLGFDISYKYVALASKRIELYREKYGLRLF